MIEQLITGVIVALLVPLINEGWKRFKEWKNDGGRKIRREVKNYDRQLRKELLALGIPKEEL